MIYQQIYRPHKYRGLQYRKIYGQIVEIKHERTYFTLHLSQYMHQDMVRDPSKMTYLNKL